MRNMKTKIHSFESFGTVDGPGIRFIVFFQGCPMRCKYCHNPDTWQSDQGRWMENEDIIKEVLKYRHYFQNGGGVTFSGGEALLQMDSVIDLLTRLKEEGIHTCVDTSGCLFDESKSEIIEKYDRLLKVCDLFLLDIKQIQEEKHKQLTGLSNKNILAFAKYLSNHHKPVWIRHVLVPGITTEQKDLEALKAFIDTLDHVEKVEVLPYHTMGIVKYENLGIDYPLKGINPPSKEEVLKAKEILCGKRSI